MAGNILSYYFKSKSEKEKMKKDFGAQSAADAYNFDDEPEEPKLEDTKTARKRLAGNLASGKYK